MSETLLHPEVRKRPTVKDIALHVGVAQPTVSVVLNGARSNIRISEPVRQKIMDAAREMGYRPNLAAQAMRRQQSRQVAVLVENNKSCPLVHPLAWEFMHGINSALDTSGHLMSLVRLNDVTDEGRLASEVVEGHLFDGLIVLNHLPHPVMERLKTLAPHTIWVDADVWEPTRCLRRDEFAAGATAVEELQKLGYREIIALHTPQGPDKHYHLAQRLEGAQSALQPGTKWSQETIRLAPNEDSYSENYAALLPRLRPDVAVLAFDIYIARTLGFYFVTQPVAVGRDFGLACCDDDHKQANHSWGHLARVQFDRFAMGQSAVAMLLNEIAEPNNPPTSQLIRGNWIPGLTAISQHA